MNEYLKKNWKAVTAVACCAAVVFAGAYYVNFVYLPGARQAQAEALDAAALAQQAQQAQSRPEDYHFSINTSLAPSNDAASSGADTPMTGADANMGSGELGEITGADGVYHGETPAVNPSAGKPAGTTPSGGTSVGRPAGDAATAPSTGGSDTRPSGPDQGGNATKPSDSNQGNGSSSPSGGSGSGSGTGTAPSTPLTGGSTTDKPSGGSNSGSSTPKMGDTRVVDGKEQMYVEGFGWTDVGDGGHTDYIEMPEGDFGGADGLGEQVGQMG